jgi:hypothetical protein
MFSSQSGSGRVSSSVKAIVSARAARQPVLRWREAVPVPGSSRTSRSTPAWVSGCVRRTSAVSSVES